jgi:hypothetical protein
MVSELKTIDAVFSEEGVGFWPHDWCFYSESRNARDNSACRFPGIRQMLLTVVC